MGELGSSESVLSAALRRRLRLHVTLRMLTLQVSDYRVSLASELQITVQPIRSVTGLRRQECVQRGKSVLSEPSSGQYRFTYPWDPAIGLTDGNYDLSCSVSDGANTSSTDYASHSDEVRLTVLPTMLEVREAAEAVVPTRKMMI